MKAGYRLNAPKAGLLAVAAALTLAGCGDRAAEPAGRSPEDVQAEVERVDAAVRKAPTGVDSGGPVRGTLHAQFDGQQRKWDITTLDDTTRFSAATYDDSFQLGIDIRGDAAQGQPEGRFILEMLFESPRGFQAGASPDSAIASLIPHKGISPPLWAGRDDLQVTLTRAEWDGQAGRVEGSFSGALCYRATMMDKPDPANCKPVEGRFASDLAAARD